MQNVRVGGPLLGHRDYEETGLKRSFEPLITDAIKGQRYILLPSCQWVTVLLYRTGQRFTTLLPSSSHHRHKNKDKNASQSSLVKVESVALVRCLNQDGDRKLHHRTSRPSPTRGGRGERASKNDSQSEVYSQILWVACHDGSFQEFNLTEILDTHNINSSDQYQVDDDSYSYRIPGTCFGPTRVVQITDQPIRLFSLLTVESADTKAFNGIVVYALVQHKDEGKKAENSKTKNASLIRFQLPSSTVKNNDHDKVSKTTESNFLDLRNSLSEKIVFLEEKLLYHVRRPKVQSEITMFPFQLTTVVQRRPGSPMCVFVLLTSSSSLSIYVDFLSFEEGATQLLQRNSTLHETVTITFPGKDPVSSLCVSSNQKDVACGHTSGTIRVYSDLLPLVEAYVKSMEQHRTQPDASFQDKPQNPNKVVITRKLRWHVHPVASLIYEGTSDSGNNDILISGGEESVMVTWHLAQGTSHPSDVLPRIALGGILHIACTSQPNGSPDGILVYCADNSLHLFQSHNRALLWKVQGLAAAPCLPDGVSHPQMRLERLAEPSSPRLWLWGLSQAPGRIQSFNPRTQQVEYNLEVAAFNRISRTEQSDSPMPVPCVTHASWSESGDDLLTIDTTMTENASIGSKQEFAGVLKIGVITTLRLWSTRLSENNRYDLVAAMAFPHGSQNRVAAAVLSPDGMHACTVSNDEKAFRLWHRIVENIEPSELATKNQAMWTCRYKVAFPSGFSNNPTGHSAVAFSSDSSVLAVAFGNVITLWDQEEVTLVSSLRHVEDDDSPIVSLRFVQSAFCEDMLLACSTGGISLQSPFGDQGLSPIGWTSAWLGRDGDEITSLDYADTTDNVAVAVYNRKRNQTRLVLVSTATGESADSFDKHALLEGQVVSIASFSANHESNSWNRNETKTASDDAIQNFVLTKEGVMISSSRGFNDETEYEQPHAVGRDAEIPRVPRLTLAAGSNKPGQRKRALDVLTADDIVGSSKKLSLNNFGSFVGGDATILSTNQLPQLSGAFVRAFVGRRLQKE